ncbi:hypothetical protein ACFFRR_010370 [Megaselia abdita]
MENTGYNIVLLFFFFLFSNSVFCQSADIDEICRLRGDEGLEFLKYPEDCSNFVICEDTPYVGSCGEGDYFDEESQTCDIKEKVQCGSEPIPETTTSTTTSTTTTTTEAPTATTTTTEALTTLMSSTTTMTTDKTEIPKTTTVVIPTSTSLSTVVPVTTAIPSTDECPEDGGNGIFIPSRTSCNNYYFCFENKPMLMHCANNLYFNPSKGKCDFKENVQCSAGKPTCISNENEFYPHETSCNFFYFCIGGHLSLQQCPYFYYWSVEERECRLKLGHTC